MNKKQIVELRAVPVTELDIVVEGLRRDLFVLRLNAKTSHVKSFASEQKKLKKTIACALTIARERQIQTGK